MKSRGDLYNTPFEGYRSLGPGEQLLVDNSGLRKSNYWEPGIREKMSFSSDEECVEATEELVSNLVRETFVDKPSDQAIFLNGQLNSTFWLSHLRSQPNIDRIHGISYLLPPNYEGPHEDDRSYIELLQKHYDFQLIEVCEPYYKNPFDERIEMKMDVNDTPGVNPIGSDHDVIFPAVRSLDLHYFSTGLFDFTLSYTGSEYYRDLLIERKFEKLIKALLERQRLQGDSVRKFFRSTIPQTLTPTTYKLLRGLKTGRFHDQEPTLLNLHTLQEFEVKSRKRELRIKGSHPHLYRQKDVAHFFKKGLGQGKKPPSSVQRRFDISSYNPLYDRRMIEWMLKMPSEQLIPNDKRPSLFRRMCLRRDIPEIVLNKTKSTAWPPDLGDRRRHAKPFLIEEFDKIAKDDPVWNWADRQMALDMFEKIRNNDDYPAYRASYRDLIKYPLISRYFKLINEKWGVSFP